MNFNMTLSIIIPSRNEQSTLEGTIRNVLANTDPELTELIVILDGWLPTEPIETGTDRVRFVHFQEAIGQRPAINHAARMSTAKYICKLDAHCQVAPGFDKAMIAGAEHLGRNVTQVPRMFNLDANKFKADWTQDCAKRHKQTDRMYIGWNEKGELRSLYYGNRQAKAPANGYHDTMGCMGPCFFLDREYFWETGGCEEAFGHWGSQGIEVAAKAWLSGGRLVCNTHTWFAHWFRGSDGGFPYPISGRMINKGRQQAKSTFVDDKWEKAVRPWQFLLDKFNPPTWENKMTPELINHGYVGFELPYVEGAKVVDLGSGTRPRRKGITNVDIRKLPNVDIVSDLRELEAFEDGEVDTIISSDVIEHFGRWEFDALMKEWLRILKPGGRAYITTVDLGKTMERFRDYSPKKWMDAVYGGQKYPTDYHKNGWTKEMLIEQMQAAGWKTTGIKRFKLNNNYRMCVHATK